MFESRGMQLLSEVSSLLSEGPSAEEVHSSSLRPQQLQVSEQHSSRKSAHWGASPASAQSQFLDVSDIRMNALPASPPPPPLPRQPIPAPAPPGAMMPPPQSVRELYAAPVPNPEFDAVLQLIARASENVHLCEIDVVARRVRQQEIDELTKAIELLQDERKLLKRRCAIIYDSINEVNERHAKLVEVLTTKLNDEQPPMQLFERAVSASGGSNTQKGSGTALTGKAASMRGKGGGPAGPGGAASSSSATSPFPLPISSGPLTKATVDMHYAHFEEATKRLAQR